MRREAPSTELDLIPIMNMVTILIPFLLMSAAFTTVAVVDVKAPASADGVDEPAERPSVAVTGQGLQFTGADGSTATIPCSSALCTGASDYDLVELRRALTLHKERVPEGEALDLITGDEVQYDVLIAVMDASRQDGAHRLYPDVRFASVATGG